LCGLIAIPLPLLALVAVLRLLIDGRQRGGLVYREFVEIAKTFQTEGQRLDWTVYRIGVITDAEGVHSKAGFIGGKGSSLQISRKAMAAWLLEQVEALPQHWIREIPYIWSA
jgi:hypothetical protein